MDPMEVLSFFREIRPDVVFLAAAKVGGILANQAHPAEFIYTNILIQTSVIHAAYLTGVKRLFFFGSTCAYPKECPQPMEEQALLSGHLEPTSEPYAIAKIAGMKMCEAYNKQYGTCFLSIIPATLYGPHDNFDPNTSHVMSALIHKFSEVKAGRSETVAVWGSGDQRREFLYVDDLADACIHLMELEAPVLKAAVDDSGFIINVGAGEDIRIWDLALLIGSVVGIKGFPVQDVSKPDGARRKLLHSTRINKLGWSPRVPLREGIVRTYEWYCGQGIART
jgi:GDP-L-fucose synthase